MKEGDKVYIVAHGRKTLPTEAEVDYCGTLYFSAGEFTFLRAKADVYPLLGRHARALAYPSKEAYEECKERQKLWTELRYHAEPNLPPESVSLEDIRSILNILKGKKDA